VKEIGGRLKRRYKVKRFYSPTKAKILLLLEAGVALSFAGTLGKQFRILGELADEWKDVERQYLSRVVREFYIDRLISMTDNKDGTTTAVLTEKGKRRALTFNFKKMNIKVPDAWDGFWHVVIFDIPEKYKAARLSLRDKLLALGFFQCQKSVYLHPFTCEDEVEFISQFFKVGKYVRYGTLKHITNEAELLLHFSLKKPSHTG
jgi:hypothetical protein